MIQISSSLTTNHSKKNNKHIKRDSKLTIDWIRANKLSLNGSKTENILFKPRNKKITKQLNFRVSGKKIQQLSHVQFALGCTANKPSKKNKKNQNNHSIGLLSQN